MPGLRRVTMFEGTRRKGKKKKSPEVQPREVAQKAIKEIKGVPPKLMLYALGGSGHPDSADRHRRDVLHSQPEWRRRFGPETADAGRGNHSSARGPASRRRRKPRQLQRSHREETSEPQAQPVASPKSRIAKEKGGCGGSADHPWAAVPGFHAAGRSSADRRQNRPQLGHAVCSDESCNPGNTTITVSKAGYSTDTRTVAVNIGESRDHGGSSWRS